MIYGWWTKNRWKSHKKVPHQRILKKRRARAISYVGRWVSEYSNACASVKSSPRSFFQSSLNDWIRSSFVRIGLLWKALETIVSMIWDTGHSRVSFVSFRWDPGASLTPLKDPSNIVVKWVRDPYAEPWEGVWGDPHALSKSRHWKMAIFCLILEQMATLGRPSKNRTAWDAKSSNFS